jgi:hypothetical protein
MNCATAACFLIGDYYFNRREAWMIENLDTDDEFPPTHLRHVIDRYPAVKDGLRTHNKRCSMLSNLLAVMLAINFIVSAAFLLRRAGKVEKICCPGLFAGGASRARDAACLSRCAQVSHAHLLPHAAQRRRR